MLTQEIITYLLALSALVSIIFSIYNSFKKPQEKAEIKDAVFDVKFRSLESTVINLRDNHLHTLDTKLDAHISENQLKALSDAKWQSRIETLLEQLNKK